MALNRFRCKECEAEFSSLKMKPLHCEREAERLLSVPQAKFLEPRVKEKGTSALKDQNRILMERAKNHARENDYHELIQNNDRELAKRVGWIRQDGGVRKKVDDL